MPVGERAPHHHPDREPAHGADRLVPQHGETLVRRMAEKGLLRWEQGARAKLYYPIFHREEAALGETRSFLKKVFGGSVGLMVNAMAESEELSRGDRPALRRSAEIGGEAP